MRLRFEVRGSTIEANDSYVKSNHDIIASHPVFFRIDEPNSPMINRKGLLTQHVRETPALKARRDLGSLVERLSTYLPMYLGIDWSTM